MVRVLSNALAQFENGFGRGRKSHLIVTQPYSRETRPHIQGRQQSDSDTDALGRSHQRQRHLQRVGIRPTSQAVVQIMKFTHLRVTGLQ